MSYVYVLRSGDENIFKIGRTKSDVDRRIKQLSTGNPYPLKPFEIIETDHESQCESYLHRRLGARRVNSGPAQEFFAITPDELTCALNEVKIYLEEWLPVVVEAEKFEQEDSDGSVKPLGNEAESIYRQLLELRSQMAKLELREKYLESCLKVQIGKAEHLGAIASWTTKIGNRFDQSTFKEKEPEIYNRYLKESRSRIFRLKK